MNKKLIDLWGMRFGRLLVIGRSSIITGATEKQAGQRKWRCRCDCGNLCYIRSGELRYGKATSCGCYNAEKNFKHGHATREKGKSRTYTTWQEILNKCYNPNSPSYAFYGGRGITLCKRWFENFDNFLSDMGEKPKGLTIERINNDGNYEPENCKWGTYSEQNRNKRHGPPRNKTSGLPTGVIRSGKKFRGAVTINCKYHYLGTFETTEQAKEAVKARLREYGKEHLYKEF
jgi:hypothetical protein